MSSGFSILCISWNFQFFYHPTVYCTLLYWEGYTETLESDVKTVVPWLRITTSLLLIHKIWNEQISRISHEVYILRLVCLQRIKRKLWTIFYSFRIGNENPSLWKMIWRQFFKILILSRVAVPVFNLSQIFFVNSLCPAEVNSYQQVFMNKSSETLLNFQRPSTFQINGYFFNINSEKGT